MREILIGETTDQTENGESYTCEYRLLVRETEGRFSCESYGVRVTLKRSGESSELWDITMHAGRIEELMTMLMRNTVTPCTLVDVVQDWL
ncbi:MAG: DUF6514 family protein [Evtepia sp.]